MTTNYQRGANFERTVARLFEENGFVTVRSAGSHSPADIVAMRADCMYPVCVQCKTNGRLDPDEWNEFYDFCQRAGAIPVLARKGERGKIELLRLTGSKEGKGPQPMVGWSMKGGL